MAPRKKKTAAGKSRNQERPPKKTEGRKQGNRQSKDTGTDEQTPGGDKPEEPSEATFPIVAIGASAGGLEALQEFFDNMPDDNGMAFVVITHQHPGHVSMLPDLLSHHTHMSVVAAEDEMQVEPNHVYVRSPGGDLTITEGAVHLTPTDTTRAVDLPIDTFFRSLALDARERAVCIVLSGTGTDGTLGTREVKAQGGVALAQQPRTARYGGMPSSAEATGVVDFIEAPAKMPEWLLDYVRGPFHRARAKEPRQTAIPQGELTQLVLLLRSRTGHDFSQYKQTTLRRRIERRMGVHQIAQSGKYVQYLRENPAETEQLFSELLVSVTSFFRDPDAFESLTNESIPHLFEHRKEATDLRVWIPGCATGEEAYSIAILLQEAKQRMHMPFDIRIFATDLDERAIERARRGTYPAGIAADVSKERLERFFSRLKNGDYRISKKIREMIIFSKHNLLGDPPFTKLDMLVCRNLLIYLQSELQKQLVPMFHYAINTGGLLFLGSAETTGDRTDLFETIDSKRKIFRRKEGPGRLPDTELFRRGGTPTPQEPQQPRPEGEQPEEGEERERRRIEPMVEHMLLERFTPVSILVDAQGTIHYIHGRTGTYLEPEQRRPRNKILDMAREGLKAPLASALHQVSGGAEETTRQRIQVKTNGDHVSVDLSVSPINDPEPLRGLYLVSIVPGPPPEPKEHEGKEPSKEKSARVEDLRRQVRYLEDSHQATVEKLQTSNEELKSSNEELQSTNEELQSVNEELQTSKEELQSLNEEMSTVNNELESRVAELRQTEDDMTNMLNGTDLAVVFLDEELRIKRYTEQATNLVSLRDTDVGRPLADLSLRIEYESLERDCRHVLDTLERVEQEVTVQDDGWRLLRILPYRTSENVIAGVVLTLTDITRVKRAETEALASSSHFYNIVQTVREPLLVLDGNLTVTMANESFCRAFKANENDILKRKIYHLGNRQWDIPQLRELLEKILPEKASFTDFEVEHDFPTIGHKRFVLNARRLEPTAEQPALILLAMEERAQGNPEDRDR